MSTYRVASAGAKTQPTDDISVKSKRNMSLDELIEIRYGCLTASASQLDDLLKLTSPELATTGWTFTVKTVREASMQHIGNPRISILRVGKIRQIRGVAFVAALPENTPVDLALRWAQDGQVLQLLHGVELVRYGYESRKERVWS
ncbi:hypothetical protein Rt10032_c03g1503 [Rhodotorula toruloides]|uniref:Uncharacterized protein n=1 Tax=Rhodotorula toruloides TaxID=5286 RepID=A0A511KC27_RHOTO|nr:hypothetical protein Rt10032_c03g1430 [Rhodotorula toruloides]GEM07486.1 hypothetical protein Rt10032_c03g1503 [Rhodotorula toruloides]